MEPGQNQGRGALALGTTMYAEVLRHHLPRLYVAADMQLQARHMTVNQIIGGWGTTSLVSGGLATPKQNRRRRVLLGELVDSVRLMSGGDALVITCQDIEERSASPGIRTSHFNAISGLDTFGNVRSVFVIGRPLPAANELLTMARALTGRPNARKADHVETQGAVMADGTGAPINVRVFGDPIPEAPRAAITDAEIIQAVGRGRGATGKPTPDYQCQLPTISVRVR